MAGNVNCYNASALDSQDPDDSIAHAIILEAKVLLRHGDLKNYEIAERLNFPNASIFNKSFKKKTGQTPLGYKES